MKTFLLAIAVAMLSTAALADPPGNNGGGNGGCGVGQQTNGCGTTTTPTVPSVEIDNNLQALIATYVKSTLSSTSTSTSAGGAGGSGVGTASSYVGPVTTGPSTSSATTGPSTSSASAPTTVAPAQTVSFTEEAQKRNPVAGAYSAPINPGDCGRAFSIGLQTIGVGTSVAIPLPAKDRERRCTAALLFSMGEKEAAILLLANDPAVNKAVTEARKR